jgi:DNA-binding NarL/FixJ family response regulator
LPRIAALRAQGRSWASIADALGVGEGTVRRAIAQVPQTAFGEKG